MAALNASPTPGLAVFQEPFPGEALSGDAFVVVEAGRFLTVAVADGLGHGPQAHAASRAAMDVIRARPEAHPEDLLMTCHGALMGTVGAMMAVVRVDREAGHLVHAGLGNVEVRLVAADRTHRPANMHGVVGSQIRKIRSEVFPFAADDILLMHTDGVCADFGTRPTWRDLPLDGLAATIAAMPAVQPDDRLLLLLRLAPVGTSQDLEVRS